MLIVTSCATQRGFPPEHQIVNFDQVAPTLYRGAQPTHNGLKYLASLGVKTVVNLRQPDDVLPDEEAAAKALDMTYVSMPMSGLAAPSREQVLSVLAVIEKSPKPVFVHCQYGCDRTGAVIACWRITQGWNNEKALAEAEAYGISPLLVGFKGFVRRFAP